MSSSLEVGFSPAGEVVRPGARESVDMRLTLGLPALAHEAHVVGGRQTAGGSRRRPDAQQTGAGAHQGGAAANSIAGRRHTHAAGPEQWADDCPVLFHPAVRLALRDGQTLFAIAQPANRETGCAEVYVSGCLHGRAIVRAGDGAEHVGRRRVCD